MVVWGELRVEATLENLRKVSEFLRDIEQRLLLTEESSFDLDLATEEAAANIVRHAYTPERPGDILVRVETDDDTVRITLTDWGVPFDAGGVSPFDAGASVETRAEGGMGLQLINHLMDNVVRGTAPTPGGPNTFVLTKHREPRRASDVGTGARGEEIEEGPHPWINSAISLRTLLASLGFGMAALAVVEAGLTLPMPGSGVVTDPGEVFTTTGASFTGPVGGALIGILAGFREPEIPLASVLAHALGGLWMAFSFKFLVHERLEMPAKVLGWAALVLVYYYVFVIPGFVIGQAVFYADGYAKAYGEGTSLLRAYGTLGEGALPEALLTTVVTSLAFIALPRRNRRPMW